MHGVLTDGETPRVNRFETCPTETPNISASRR